MYAPLLPTGGLVVTSQVTPGVVTLPVGPQLNIIYPPACHKNPVTVRALPQVDGTSCAPSRTPVRQDCLSVLTDGHGSMLGLSMLARDVCRVPLVIVLLQKL